MKRASPGRSASSFSISRATRRSNLLVLTLVLMLAIGGCASQQSATDASQDLVAPMPIEFRQRADAVVLRVVANSEFQLDLGDTLEGSSSEERTTAGADAVKKGAGTIMTTGCDPRMLYVWIISCPGGILVGAGVALTGSIGSAVYGHTTAWSRDDINAAKAALGRTQLQTNLANELRDRLISTLQDTTSTRIIQNETAATATRQPTNDNTSTIVLAVDIEGFFVSEVGEMSPDLWVDFEVSAGLYEFPDTRPLYKRRWLLYTELGDYHDLISAGGLGLRTKLNAAFDKMALAVANDLFMTEKSIASDVDDELNGEVVTTYTSVPSVSGVELPDREEILSSYLLYLAEHDIAYPESLNTQGITGTNTEPSQPTADEFSATLGALKLSFERGELSDEEFMQKQRAVVNEYTRNTRAGLGIEASSSSGKHLRVALLPFAKLPRSWYDATFYDVVHEYVGMRQDMELVFSEYDTRFKRGLAGTEAEVWKGTFTQKSPNKPWIVRGAKRVDADVAVLISHKKRTAGWYGDEFVFSVYVMDVETNRTYTMQGTELNYEKVIEEALKRALKGRPQDAPGVDPVSWIPPAQRVSYPRNRVNSRFARQRDSELARSYVEHSISAWEWRQLL